MTKRHRDGSITVQLAKRHAKPTSAQLTARMYRRLIMTESRLAETKQEVRSLNANLTGWSTLIISQIGKHAESMRLVADHCARLLKEKETLQRQMEAMKDSTAMRNVWRHNADTIGIPTFYTDGTVARAPDFQAARHGACAFASSHRPGIRCGVCGETPT